MKLRLVSLSKYIALSFFVSLMANHAVLAQQTISIVIPPMNVPPTGVQHYGKIIWHDLFTRDVTTARDFYSQLFGWRYQPYTSGAKTYTLLSHNGKSIAGIVELESGSQNENQWVSYISVVDVKRAFRHVTANGGKVLLSPRLFHQQGELAIFTDPEGAAFGVLNSMSGDPEDVLAKPGEWIWADLLSKNPRQITQFYQGVADYIVVDDTRSPETNDYFLHANGFARAGVNPLPADDILPNWLPYIRVENVMDSLMQVTRLGGRTIIEPDPGLFDNKLAVIADPAGAVFGIVQINQ
jgi:predicted enzyme related to lactoylglutathione lyase